MKELLPSVIFLAILQSCTFKPGSFPSTSVPSVPDYADLNSWAASPHKNDMADLTPEGLSDNQATSNVDVFFIHPTTYIGKGKTWNADIGNSEINRKTDETAIKFQASIFNGVGRVFAPRYRQVHLSTFSSKDTASTRVAFELAYHDVRAAFEYFLENENKGRPIVIAAHSQGALHAIELLKEFFDGKQLQKKLVAAYVVGWPVRKKEFKTIEPCIKPNQTGCFCSWRTFKYGYLPRKYALGDHISVTNPLSWDTEKDLIPKGMNKGAVLRDFEVLQSIVDAQINKGILWSNKPKFKGSVLFTRKNYHIADMNFFYVDIRKNAQVRASTFLRK